MSKESIFETIHETKISTEAGGLSITQRGEHGEVDCVFIPGRYVPEFLSELKRVWEGQG